MSILIKSMEMPKDCNNCKFFNDNYDYPTCSVTDYSRGYNWNPRGQRMPDCPLVEVPPHGRLIDADALMEHIWREQLDSRERIAQMVNTAPTIVEAEE